MIQLVLHALFYLAGSYLLFNCLYLLFFAVAGHKRTTLAPRARYVKLLRRFCILIPAYKADSVVLESSLAALRHAYNGDFDVVVIADGLQKNTIQTLQQQGAGVVEVIFSKSTKGKALAAALELLPQHEYDVAVVLDVDNIMGPHFLNQVNDAFEAGYKVVQTHRTAKNMDSAFALLDACNEEINNHIFRKGHFALGMSSSLIGSGMAFDFSYLKQLLHGIGDTVGEDKEIDFRVLKDQEKICYLDQALVYDEKIDNAAVFTKQRTRWIATQIEYFRKYALQGLVQFLKYGNFEFMDKILQTALLPRTLLIGVLGLFFLASLVIPFGPPVVFWATLLGMLATALLLSLPARLYNRQLWKAMVRLPYAVYCMCAALFSISKARNSFMPTPHKVKGVTSTIEL